MSIDISFDPSAIKNYLVSSTTIAVVGLSEDTSKASYGVARYMQNTGYRIIPVNPTLTGPVLGEKAYAKLVDIPSEIRIDIINVFRRPADMPGVVEQALLRIAPLFWMQLGISHDESANGLIAAGFDVVQNRCIKVDHALLIG